MSRPRRRLFIVLGLVACIVMAAGVAWLLWPRRPAITRANAAMIEKGMTIGDVEALLGGPARDESTGVLDPDLKIAPGNLWREWRSDEVIIHVLIDRNGRVSARTVLAVRRVTDQQSRFSRVRRLVGL
jgi:hypothetical protein